MEKPSKRKPKIRNRLYNCRKAINLTQEEAAFRMGLNRCQISKWERGEKDPNIYNAVGLAVATRSAVEDIFFDYRKEWEAKIRKRIRLRDLERQNAQALQ